METRRAFLLSLTGVKTEVVRRGGQPEANRLERATRDMQNTKQVAELLDVAAENPTMSRRKFTQDWLLKIVGPLVKPTLALKDPVLKVLQKAVGS